MSGGEPTHSALAVIEVDRDLCSGHARCLTIAPDLFDLDDEGRSNVLHQPATPQEVEDALRAARGCPEQAITINELS